MFFVNYGVRMSAPICRCAYELLGPLVGSNIFICPNKAASVMETMEFQREKRFAGNVLAFWIDFF